MVESPMHSATCSLFVFSLLVTVCVCSIDFNQGVLIQMMEWKYTDIAQECEEFLAFKGYKGVQISPPNENLVLPGRPWYERYQPVSYKLTTRSGTREELADMLLRCNKVGIRVFADTIINHMSGNKNGSCYGTSSSACDANNFTYPAVPYTRDNFHWPPCFISDYDNATNVRDCELSELHDLNQTQEYVRQKIEDYMNGLIELGLAGFRVDAAKHMNLNDLDIIYSSLNHLNESHGFPPETRPFIYQEVSRFGTSCPPEEYTYLGSVTEFGYSRELSRCFLIDKDIKRLHNFGPEWGFLPSNKSLVFVDNHDLERNDLFVNFKMPKLYKMTVAFMLAWPYGTKKVMSSYNFSHNNDGPPHDSDEGVLSAQPAVDNKCSNGWVCQHRWSQITNMVTFHNAVSGTNVSSWWDNGKNQIAFCRGNKGFIAFNLETNKDLSQRLQTCLPAGTYCDVISGNPSDKKCTGKTVEVSDDGTAQIVIGSFDPNSQEEGVLALHVKISSSCQMCLYTFWVLFVCQLVYWYSWF